MEVTSRTNPPKGVVSGHPTRGALNPCTSVKVQGVIISLEMRDCYGDADEVWIGSWRSLI